jgi:hypothetical protein
LRGPASRRTLSAVPISTPDKDPSAVASAMFSVPADAVWRYRLDFSNLPHYNPDVSNVTQTQQGQPDGVGADKGPGARYSFTLADPRSPQGQPVELWITDAVHPTLVAAGMSGGSDAYEEFVVLAQGEQACQATLMLWLTLPEGIGDDIAGAATAGALAQIEKEMRLMKEALEGRAATS